MCNSESPNALSNNMLKILYYNARSLLPKFDELLILADSHNPDVICITESWLSVDIQDSEILIPGYQSLQKQTWWWHSHVCFTQIHCQTTPFSSIT